MDLAELKKYSQYCAEIGDLPSLYIIQYLLGDASDGIESKIELWRKYRDFVASKYEGMIPRQTEDHFETSFGILLEKKILGTDRNKSDIVMLALDKPPEEYGDEVEELQKIAVKDLEDLTDVGKAVLDKYEAAEHGNPPEPDFDIMHVIEHVADDAIFNKDDFEAVKSATGSGKWNTYREAIDELENLSTDSWAKVRINPEHPAYTEALQKHGRFIRLRFPNLKLEENIHDKEKTSEVDELIAKLSKEDKNKAAVTNILDQAELQIRRLLIWKNFRPQKSSVPGGIREKIDKQVEARMQSVLKQTSSGEPKKLSHAEQFLNTATLGELIEILLFWQKNTHSFDDVFPDFTKTEFYCRELIELRNFRSHNNELINWNDSMVDKAKTVSNEIIIPILRWRTG